MKFLEDLYLKDYKNVEELVSFIFEWFNENYEKEDYSICNTCLSFIDFDKINELIMIAILGITFHYKEKFSNRKIFYDRVKEKIALLRPNEADSILRGLE